MIWQSIIISRLIIRGQLPHVDPIIPPCDEWSFLWQHLHQPWEGSSYRSGCLQESLRLSRNHSANTPSTGSKCLPSDSTELKSHTLCRYSNVILMIIYNTVVSVMLSYRSHCVCLLLCRLKNVRRVVANSSLERTELVSFLVPRLYPA